MTSALESQPADGVWYRSEDYAGFYQRFAILAIDGGVLAIAAILIIPLSALHVPELALFLAWLAFALAYLVFLEAYTGTLGFFLLNVKIVNLCGERPSLFRMLFRLMLWTLGGPFQFWVDLLWMTGDDRKQTVRDKIAGTYVVRKDALPIGNGRVKLRRLMFMGFNMLFSEVETSSKR